MKDFREKVAVVTGGASGIGFALAAKFADAGMHVVLADIETEALEQAAENLRGWGGRVLPVVCDVSKSTDVKALADRTLEEFGAVHVLCNNAGVFLGGQLWESPIEDYEWVFGVNVWGVIHGIRTFVPIMLAQAGDAHIVNTASMAGLTTLPYASIYHTSKHAVVALSECLYHELAMAGANVKVSVLCPEAVATNIDKAARNRPATLGRPEGLGHSSPEEQLVLQALGDQIENEKAAHPETMAERVYQAIIDERFYILSDDGWRDSCLTRHEDIREGRNPTFAPPVS